MAEKHKDEIKGVVLFYPAFYMADHASEVLQQGPTENIRNSGPNDISYDNGQLYDWDNLLVSERYLNELSQIGIRDKIRALNKDVIVLQGDIDEDVTLDSTNYFIQFFPSAELVVIKDGEHGFFDEQLEQAEKASIRFMKNRL